MFLVVSPIHPETNLRTPTIPIMMGEDACLLNSTHNNFQIA
jgi:hypothetical protein